MSSNQNGTLEREMYPHQTPHLGDSGSQHPPNTQLSTSVDSIVIATSMGKSGTVVPPPYSPEEASVPELRGSLDCWACSVLVATQNLIIVIVNVGLAALVLGLILSPAIIMVVFGFLCHSTVRPHSTSYYCLDLLTDGGCVTLLVVGFLLVTPLLVLALAAYCRLARHLQLGLCFIPYSRAVYKNLPAKRHHGFPGNLCSQQEVVESEGKGSVWV